MYCLTSIRCSGEVYILCNSEGELLHTQDGKARLERKYAELLSRGGTWDTSVSLDMLENDPRFHNVETPGELIGPIIVVPFSLFEIFGTVRKHIYGVKCEGPEAQQWHFRGDCPRLADPVS